MLEAIVRGKVDPGWLADYARGTLRRKKEELARALHGRSIIASCRENCYRSWRF